MGWNARMVILVSRVGSFSKSASPSLVIGNSLPIQGLILQLGCKTEAPYNSVDYVSGTFWGCVLALVRSR